MAEKLSLEIVKFCTEEVERQQDSPIAVFHMVNAWMDAMSAEDADEQLSEHTLIRWGNLVRPEKNPPDKFRNCGVRVGSHIAPEPWKIPTLIDGWIKRENWETPEEAYKQFQLIHPFRDGNGRVGKIIFNYLKGTLANPVLPPNFFGCINL